MPGIAFDIRDSTQIYSSSSAGTDLTDNYDKQDQYL